MQCSGVNLYLKSDFLNVTRDVDIKEVGIRGGRMSASLAGTKKSIKAILQTRLSAKWH